MDQRGGDLPHLGPSLEGGASRPVPGMPWALPPWAEDTLLTVGLSHTACGVPWCGDRGHPMPCRPSAGGGGKVRRGQHRRGGASVVPQGGGTGQEEAAALPTCSWNVTPTPMLRQWPRKPRLVPPPVQPRTGAF